MRLARVLGKHWLSILLFTPLSIALIVSWECFTLKPDCKPEKEWGEKSARSTDTTEYRDSTVTITYTRHGQETKDKPASGESAKNCSFACYVAKKTADDPIALFTAGLLYVTWGLAIFTFQLWRSSVAQGIISHKAFVEDKRAFIYPIDVAYLATTDARGFHNWRLQPFIRNSGTTATTKMWTDLKVLVQDERISTSWNGDPIFNEFDDEPRAGFFPPQQNFFGDIVPHEPRPAISPEQFSASQRKEKFIYLIGRFIYYDRFPETFQHVSGFCWEISMLTDPFATEPPENARFKWTQVPAGCYERDGEISNKWVIN